MNANADSQVVHLPDESISAGSQRPIPAAVWMGRLLASSATLLSLAVSGLVGWQRGSTAAAQFLLAAIGILAVLGVHWLLPLLRAVQAGFAAMLIGLPLWLACLVYTATSHADFFIDIQAQRSEHRVTEMEAVYLSPRFEPKRGLPAILEELSAVRVKWMQARLAEAGCDANCAAFKLREIGLRSRVTTLEAEEEEYRRWQVAQDQQRQRREALRDDPVTARLQRDFGATPAITSLVTVLPVAVILEGLGAFCWCLVLQGRARPVTRRVTRAVRVAVTPRVTMTADGNAGASSRTQQEEAATMESTAPRTAESAAAEARHDDAAQRQVEVLAAKVWTEIQQGRVQPTVRAIRASLGIAQQQARAVAQVVRGLRAAAPGRVGPRHAVSE